MRMEEWKEIQSSHVPIFYSLFLIINFELFSFALSREGFSYTPDIVFSFWISLSFLGFRAFFESSTLSASNKTCNALLP